MVYEISLIPTRRMVASYFHYEVTPSDLQLEQQTFEAGGIKLPGVSCDKLMRDLTSKCGEERRNPYRNDKVVTRFPQCNLVTTLAQPCILKLSQGCDKVVARLSQGCTNIVTRLSQCTLSQPCILKLWQL